MAASIEIVRHYCEYQKELRASFGLKTDGIFRRRNGETIDVVLGGYLDELGMSVPVLNQVLPGENDFHRKAVIIKPGGVEVVWPLVDWKFQVVGDNERRLSLGWQLIGLNPRGGVMYFGRRELMKRIDELSSVYLVFRPERRSVRKKQLS